MSVGNDDKITERMRRLLGSLEVSGEDDDIIEPYIEAMITSKNGLTPHSLRFFGPRDPAEAYEDSSDPRLMVRVGGAWKWLGPR